ncbi:MAG: lysylphosphatidylglycerol synthase transmembrane domain-containing protein [Candidatus Binatia bacterium]
MKNNRDYGKLFVCLSASGLFLYLAFRGEDWSKLSDTLAKADFRYALHMGGIGIYALYVRSQRWRLILELSTRKAQAIGPLFSASAIAFMANMLLPLRVGEIIKPYLVSQHTEVPMSTALATVVLERILDLVALFVFALLVVSWLEVPTEVRNMTWIAGGIAASGAVVIAVVQINRERLLPVLDGWWAKLPQRIAVPLVKLEHQFLNGIAAVSGIVAVVQLLVWSAYLWLVIAVSFAFGFLAFDLAVPFLGGGVTVTALVALAVAVPSAPAFVGQFEWGCKLALESVYSVPGNLAGAYAIFTHATQFAVQVLLGLVYLVKEGLSFRELGRIHGTAGDRV